MTSSSSSPTLRRVQAASARWIAGALALTAAAWLVALAGFLAIADRIHDDLPAPLAVKLLPLRLGTLIRFIREAFNARLAADQRVADLGSQPTALGLKIIDRTQGDDRWPADIGSHAHYAEWDLSGPKARFGIAALCDMVPLTRKLTALIPPWAPRYDRASDPAWREKDDQYANLIIDAGRRCGFDVLNIQSIPGLEQGNYADEMHVNASGVPIYTRYLVSRLKR